MEKNERIRFVYATSDTNFYIRRLLDGEKVGKDYYEFLEQEIDNHVVESTLDTEPSECLLLMVEPFWSLTTKDEKIKILNEAMKQYAGKAFDGAKFFDDKADFPIIYENDKTLLNISSLYRDDIPSCVYLASILTINDDTKHNEYMKSRKRINSVLDYENIDDLRTNYIITPIDLELSQKEFEVVTEKFYQDMPIVRHRTYNVLMATKLLLEEAHEVGPLTGAFQNQMVAFIEGTIEHLRSVHDVLDANQEEIDNLDYAKKMYEDPINRIGVLNYVDYVTKIFVKADKKRDAKYVLKVNEKWNQLAKNEHRYNDVVDDQTALEYFGLAEPEHKKADEPQAKTFDA